MDEHKATLGDLAVKVNGALQHPCSGAHISDWSAHKEENSKGTSVVLTCIPQLKSKPNSTLKYPSEQQPLKPRYLELFLEKILSYSQNMQDCQLFLKSIRM